MKPSYEVIRAIQIDIKARQDAGLPLPKGYIVHPDGLVCPTYDKQCAHRRPK